MIFLFISALFTFVVIHVSKTVKRFDGHCGLVVYEQLEHRQPSTRHRGDGTVTRATRPILFL